MGRGAGRDGAASARPTVFSSLIYSEGINDWLGGVTGGGARVEFSIS